MSDYSAIIDKVQEKIKMGHNFTVSFYGRRDSHSEWELLSKQMVSNITPNQALIVALYHLPAQFRPSGELFAFKIQQEPEP